MTTAMPSHSLTTTALPSLPSVARTSIGTSRHSFPSNCLAVRSSVLTMHSSTHRTLSYLVLMKAAPRRSSRQKPWSSSRAAGGSPSRFPLRRSSSISVSKSPKPLRQVSAWPSLNSMALQSPRRKTCASPLHPLSTPLLSASPALNSSDASTTAAVRPAIMQTSANPSASS